MNGSIKRKQIFHSMMEFEKEYFPKSFKKKMEEKPTDARELGISQANESLDKIKNLLAE
jgi:hypothetical protein